MQTTVSVHPTDLKPLDEWTVADIAWEHAMTTWRGVDELGVPSPTGFADYLAAHRNYYDEFVTHSLMWSDFALMLYRSATPEIAVNTDDVEEARVLIIETAERVRYALMAIAAANAMANFKPASDFGLITSGTSLPNTDFTVLLTGDTND